MEFLAEYQIVAITIIVLGVIYSAVIKPYIVSKTNIGAELLGIIDYACESGVGFAEQLYKTESEVDRKELAMDFAFDIL